MTEPTEATQNLTLENITIQENATSSNTVTTEAKEDTTAVLKNRQSLEIVTNSIENQFNTTPNPSPEKEKDPNNLPKNSLESREQEDDSDDEEDLFEPVTSPPALQIPMMNFTQKDGKDSRETVVTREIKQSKDDNKNSTDSKESQENKENKENKQIPEKDFQTRDSLAVPDINPIPLPEAHESLSQLLKAVRSGDHPTVITLLDSPATDVLRRDPIHGQSAMHFAVRSGHLDILKVLCRPNIVSSMINLPDNRRNTALHLAVAKSRRMTKVLLENGAQVDFTNINSQSPLLVHLLTTKRDDPVITDLLLHWKANANDLYMRTSSVLHVAIDRKMITIGTRLVKHGARMDVCDDEGKMIFEKVEKKSLKRLLCHIAYPPNWVPNKARKNCMLCAQAFGLSVRRHHCRHCGRLCCKHCCDYQVACVNMPVGFKDRLRNGAPNHRLVRTCKTCYGIIQERVRAAEERNESESHGNISRMKKNRKKKSPLKEFYHRVMHIEYDECTQQGNSPVQGLSRM